MTERLAGEARPERAPPARGEFETVIGLEVHCELATATKLFCSCPTGFGAEPNTQVCPVCLGHPGTLPVLNKRAVEFAIRVGLAFNSDIAEQCLFHRKNYFYPDMPKNYQISQYDEPICRNGWLEVDGRRIGITRAHLEEDTGKSSHVGLGGRIHGATASLGDYNRAGVPLMEIVSDPDLRTPAEARAYVEELRAILAALGVSDVKMEEGSLRVDANISLRPAGDAAFGTKVEIKNMNSLRSVQRALEFEVERQTAALRAGDAVVQETRHFDETSGRTSGMRSKEEAFDYRYFPEPDLVPLRPPAEWIEALAATQPELPAARRRRLVDVLGVPADRVALLGADDERVLTDALAAGAEPAAAVAWITGEIRALGRVSGARLADLLRLIDSGAVSVTGAKQALRHMVETGSAAEEAISAAGVVQVSDEAALAEVVDRVLAAHPDEVGRLGAGEQKLVGFFVGLVMREHKGANPKLVNELIRRRTAEVSVSRD